MNSSLSWDHGYLLSFYKHLKHPWCKLMTWLWFLFFWGNRSNNEITSTSFYLIFTCLLCLHSLLYVDDFINGFYIPPSKPTLHHHIWQILSLGRGVYILTFRLRVWYCDWLWVTEWRKSNSVSSKLRMQVAFSFSTGFHVLQPLPWAWGPGWEMSIRPEPHPKDKMIQLLLLRKEFSSFFNPV